MIKLKSSKLRKKLFIPTILIFIIFNIFLMNLGVNQDLGVSNQYEENIVDNLIKDLKNQDLASDNTYSGIGAPWNATHWANRTDYDLDASFTNDSYDIVDIPLGNGWNGYKLNATINNLYDTRNWCNGTFNYGTDDTVTTPDDDTGWIENTFQNWSFTANDIVGYTNPMSGNYLDSTYGDAAGHDSLELNIEGYFTGGFYRYDQGDTCRWESSFTIPRGRVIDSTLFFEAKANHMMDSNNFELRFYINDEKVYSIGAYNFKEQFGTSWGGLTIPQGLWSNSSNVWTNPINSSIVNIKVALYNIIGSGYSGFENREYQQIFIDNIKVFVKSEAKPSQLNLKMNNKTVSDIDWGKGTVEQDNAWTTSPVQANFSSYDIGNLESYTINLKTDLNLYSRKDIPETNYETNVGSLGTSFIVNNNSIVDWEFYTFFAVPTGYKETEMILEFPEDVNVTWVSEPQDPSTNQLTLCDNSTPGLLIIPVDAISATPDGFWKFEAISSNYCEQLNIYNNVSGTWLQNNTFVSGDYINITGKITDSPLISGYIQQTKAQLHIRFPNGSIWTTQNQYKSPDGNGYIFFDSFQIPSLPPYYEVGEYETIITWNNSYNPGLNESGIIYKKFTVIHQSKITLVQDYFPDIFEDEIINLQLSFNDREDMSAIEGATVYLINFASGTEFFLDIGGGNYFLEFNTTNGVAGNNILTINANSTLYTNTQVNVSVKLILDLIVQPIGFEDTIDAKIGETIIIQLQLLDPNTNNSIENASITYSWKYGVDSINQTSPGMYQANIALPDKVQGNYKFELLIIPENSTYRTKIYSFIVVISEPIIGGNQPPSFLLWIIIGVLVSIVSALGALSLRSYVILPRKRKKEAELLSKTQKFKDLRNIQAIVIIHRLSGIPLYTKTYSILEKHKKELFSGFIQAITTIGEEFTESEEKEEKLDPKKGSYGIEKIIELDFKYFYCLISDKEDIRVVFVLKEKSSERLKSQISLLMLALNLKLSQELEDWDGSLGVFEEMVPPIINEYFELYYKGSFTIPKKIDLVALRKEKSLSKMEIRVLNVIQSMSKRNDEIITLNSIIELVSEENKDLIIEAIEVLIERKIVTPVNP